MIAITRANWLLDNCREGSARIVSESALGVLVNMSIFMTLFVPIPAGVNIRTCTEPSAAHSRKRPNARDKRLGFAIWESVEKTGPAGPLRESSSSLTTNVSEFGLGWANGQVRSGHKSLITNPAIIPIFGF